MSIWRLSVISVFLLVPVLILLGFGFYGLYMSEWGFALSWFLLGSFIVGYLLTWYWQKQRKLLKPLDPSPPLHWTDRDKKAWELVEARANAAGKLPPENMSDPHFYMTTAQSMAHDLATFYHPDAKDPVGRLTVPELLAVVELAAHDLDEMVRKYLPAGHLLTIDNFRQAQKAADWYDSARNVYWIVSALFNPVNTAMRFAASQAGLAVPWQNIQKNLVAWFYASFVHRLGNYLIELNSGRLRVGATRYRELLATHTGKAPPAKERTSPTESIEADSPPSAPEVSLALVGQTGVGKSSLINALLGEQKAATDSLPTSTGITKYSLQPKEGEPTLALYDSPGYGQEGADSDDMNRVQEAAQEADFLLLVLHAKSPAREADRRMLQDLEAWFDRHPERKQPPILAVVTHIDLLSPSMEWKPPYHWQQPSRPKEQSIHDCLLAVNEQLAEHVVDVVPVCTDSEKIAGIEEDLLPALTAGLEEACAVALVRCLHSEIETGSVKKIFGQFLEAGKAVARQAWKSFQEGDKKE